MVKIGGEEAFKKQAEKTLFEHSIFGSFYFFKKNMISRSGQKFLLPLFPGYVFFETEDLSFNTISILKKIDGFYHFVLENTNPQKLQGQSLEYFTHFKNYGELLGISKATFDENQRIVIIEGPLKNFEGNIIRVNKRCNRVTVQIDMYGSVKNVDLCYESISPK